MEFIIQGLAAGFVIGFLVLAINLLKSVGEKGLEIGEKGFKQAKKIVKEVQDNAKSDKQKVLDLDEKILIENVKKDKKISSFLEKKSVFKHIIVINKLINLIVK